MPGKKYTCVLIFFLSFFCQWAWGQEYRLQSPDGNLSVEIHTGKELTYTVSFRGKPVLLPSAIALELDHHVLGRDTRVRGTDRHAVDQLIHPVYGQYSTIRDRYRMLRIVFKGHYAVIFRAYDQGIAYRFQTDFRDSLRVKDEVAEFNLAGDPEAVLPQTNSLTTWELPYTTYASVQKVPRGSRSILPALFSYPARGIRVTLAESDLLDYPGMYLRLDSGRVSGFWARYPSKTALGSWGNFVSVVKKRTPYIAFTKGRRNFPWRVILVTDDDKKLLSTQLVYQLASPSRLKDVSWIKPGKAAWEWWSDARLPGADIPSGMDHRNTALYRYYVDFAAKNHLEYVLIDAGWSDIFHLDRVNPNIAIREVISYAKTRGVGVFLWCVASTLMDSLPGNLDALRRLGAAGIKVDFFDRNDQQPVSWYEQIAAEAAKDHLMIDFHGSSEPTGLERTYPNILNFEAVRGNECNKWDTTSNPDYHLLIPFIRMLAGPLDATPGSMHNATRTNFKPLGQGIPFSQGTRCHELAMYVVFDQPLAMLCGSPTVYDRYPDILKFLSAVPTVFDTTRVLEAKLGAYELVAKKNGDNWFVGAMTGWTPRSMTLDFSFLDPGRSYQADLYTDTPGSDTDAEEYSHQTMKITRDTKLALRLASGGGAVVYLHH